ncbi:MAG: hypothetical protein ACK46T_11540 [Bradyrhizobium sp.]|uniref:hypothetical protein n=1 Tax=Bradyrhizobium sp. TaxID=376 RepID=UPI00391A5AA5
MVLHGAGDKACERAAFGQRENVARRLLAACERDRSLGTPGSLDRLMHSRSMGKSQAFVFFEAMTRLLSLYQFNPLNYNPLRDVLEKTIDFERLRRENVAITLFSISHRRPRA